MAHNKILAITLKSIHVDLTRPRIAADRFPLGPRANRHGNRRKQRQIADGASSRPSRHRQFLGHFNVPFKLFLWACGSAGRLAPPFSASLHDLPMAGFP